MPALYLTTLMPTIMLILIPTNMSKRDEPYAWELRMRDG
jgi:hypothetical protein